MAYKCIECNDVAGKYGLCPTCNTNIRGGKMPQLKFNYWCRKCGEERFAYSENELEQKTGIKYVDGERVGQNRFMCRACIYNMC